MRFDLRVLPFGSWIHEIWKNHTGKLELILILMTFSATVTMFIPRIHQFFRGVWVGVYLLVNLFIWLTLAVGIFPLVAIGSLLVFVSGPAWNAMVTEPMDFAHQRTKKRSRNRDWRSVSIRTGSITGTCFVLISPLVHWHFLAVPGFVEQVLPGSTRRP